MQVSPRYEGPPVISIAGAAGDQLVPVSRQRRRLQGMLGDLTPEQWRSPSRCAGWTVQDVVAHVAGVNAFWHASVRAGLAGEPTRYLVAFDPKATPALMVEQMRELAPGDVLDRLAESNDAFLGLLTTLDDDGWAMPAETPPGHLPIRLLAHHALWDSWIHERDIALPLGMSPPVEPDEVRSSLRYVCALSPALALVSGAPVTGAFAVRASDPEFACVLDVGASVDVSEGVAPPAAPRLEGDAVTLVEALSLREALPASAPDEWRELLGGLARAFSV